MSEQTITATPVNAPDILRNQPLSRQVDITLETNILEPVSHNFTSATGGRSVFVLPAKGVLDAPNAAIVFQLRSLEADQAVAFNVSAGGLGCVRRITARCGGNIISQCENCGQYANIKSYFSSQNVREGVLDASHFSSNRFERRITPAKIAVGAPTTSYHQLYNVELDQASSFGENDNRNQANTHTFQRGKALGNTFTNTPEVVIKLSDLFEIFSENKLPLMAMAQTEIEIEWSPCGDANIAAGNIVENPIIEAVVRDAAINTAVAGGNARTCEVEMNTPTMILDYIHYDDVERQKIVNAVQSGGGMRLDFSEVLITRGVNPAGSNAVAGANDTYEVVNSNHILGMSQKEVKKIYIEKNYDLRSTKGQAELDADISFNTDGTVAADSGVKNHRNFVMRQFKSQQMPGEKYNFFVNNSRIYDKDVENPAIAHNYLSQCAGNFNVPTTYYDTAGYNPCACDALVSTNVANGAITTSINTGASRRYLSGSANYIGLSLDKYKEMGSVPGNGTRISSAPIEFNYSRVSVGRSGANGGAAASHTAEINLTFYICYRRSLIIRALGVDVSDA